MKVKYLILLLLVLAIPASADFSAEKGYQWLISKSNNGNYNNDIQTTAFAAMALKDSGAVGEAQKSVEWVKSLKDEDNCYPKGSCKTKDTAFAIWLLNSFGESVQDSIDWLEDAQRSALSGGNWWLQIATEDTGTCKINYKKGELDKEKTINVVKGEFPDCSSSKSPTFFDLNSCIESGLLASNPSLEFSVDCSELAATSIISVVFNTGDTYRIIQEASTNKADIALNNGCFAVGKTGSCSLDSSLYVNWILHDLNAGFDVLPWLENNYDSNNVIHNSLLSLSTGNEVYTSDMNKKQRSDGSYDGNVFTSSMGVLALQRVGNIEERGNAIDWLREKQSADGSWNSNVLNTAVALYSSFVDTSIGSSIVIEDASCFDGRRNQNEDGIDCGGPCAPCEEGICGDGICSSAEDKATCPQDCGDEQVCVVNAKCEVNFGENSENCGQDCYCGDGICDTIELAKDSCSDDCEAKQEEAVCGNDIAEGIEECDGIDDGLCPGQCGGDCTCEEEEGGFPWLLVGFVVVLILAAAIVFFRSKSKEVKDISPKGKFTPYSSKISGSGKGKGSAGQRKYSYTPASKRKTAVESDLDKSLAEAKKLLKK